jgi:hypothetical protein
MKIPPGTPRSRSFTRFTMRVGLPHFGQSVLLVVSITFLRSAVFAIFTILSWQKLAGIGQASAYFLKNSGAILRLVERSRNEHSLY